MQSIFGNIFIGGAMLLLLPAFLLSIVQERELRLKAMMKMNGGMTDSVYWSVTLVWAFCFQFIAYLWLWIVCLIIGTFYTKGLALARQDPGLVIIFLILWTVSQLSFGIAWSSAYTKYKNTSLHAYLYQFFVLIGMLVLNLAVFTTTSPPAVLFLIPHCALFRAIHLFHQRTYYLKFMDIDDEMSVILLMLFLNSLLWSAIGMYLQKVAPSEDSVQKDCCFCITEPVHYFCCGGRANSRQIHGTDAGTDKNYGQRLQDAGYGDANAGGAVVAGAASGGEGKTGSAVAASSTNRLANPLLKRRPSMLKATVQEDEDVIEERNNMISGAFPTNAPIQLFGLRKMFGSFVAVDNVSLHIPTNQCFGMLGPNGAGKTTTISMLTGLIPASKGDAVVANKDLHNELSGIYENIGVCPQFDVTWPELTIEEHLIFYARVKGVPKEAEHLEIMKLIKDIGLMDAHVKKSTSKALSGGMRRRLSLAIALVGKPPVVFLDEPTTGLDPETKRNIWALIDTFKKNR